MLKLLKYEFIKQKNILLIPILASLSCLLIYFITLGTSINSVTFKLFYFTFYFGGMYAFFYPLYIFNTEIKNKSIIMTIMTPNTATAIITARIIHSLIQIIIFSVVNIIITLLFLFNNPNLVNFDITNITHDRLLFSISVCLLMTISLITISYLLTTITYTYYNAILKILYTILIISILPILIITTLICGLYLKPNVWFLIALLSIATVIINIINTSLTTFLFNKKLNI